MKVSVVIATYNRAFYVRQAIDSVLRQTMADFELIVVDDGSTDDTAAAIAGYGDRIRYVRTENGGPACARNVGMSLARGEYICWLDSDDCFHPAKLAMQCAVLDAAPDIGMIYTEMSVFDDLGKRQEFHLRNYHESAYRRGGVTYDNLFDERVLIEQMVALALVMPAEPGWSGRYLYTGGIYDRYLTNTIVFTNSMLFRRTLYESIGPQRPGFGFFHDLEFALRLCAQARVAFLDVPTYSLRIHPEQISTRVGPRAPWVLIRKQQDLLRVLRFHAVKDRGYYLTHRRAIDRQIVRLCRAAAIPLLGFEAGSAHQRRYFPRRARTYLRVAQRHGRPQRLLTLASYLPHWPRRLVMKAESLLAGRRSISRP